MSNWKIERMDEPKKYTPTLDDIGGEPLKDSGFEDETPDPDFSDAAPNQD